MDFRVAWSPEALEDVEAIAAYISRDSAFYASAVVERMLATARNLAYFPFSGPITPELNDETVRERLVYSYRLIYRVNAEESSNHCGSRSRQTAGDPDQRQARGR